MRPPATPSCGADCPLAAFYDLFAANKRGLGSPALPLRMFEAIQRELGEQVVIHRVLAPGGSLFVTVPAYNWMWGAQDEIAHHKRRYTRPALRDSLTRAGFAIGRASYFNTLLFPPIAGIRLTRRLIPGLRSDKSDFHFPAPGPLNRTLTRLFGLESGLVARTNLPFGVSILCLAQRPLDDQ